jgi:hypothetical protein
MKYQKATLSYLGEATSAIQGNPMGPKVIGPNDGATSVHSSTASSYPVTE